MNLPSIARRNEETLRRNVYPGRGIVIGLSPDAGRLMQVYWIMGRSENSRNRVFVEEDGQVRTKAFDESKVTDPSLIIYYPVRNLGRRHVVSNGDQTDTVVAAFRAGRTFEEALSTREFEPDKPNYTPRITGSIDLDDRRCLYRLSILKAAGGDPAFCQRHFFHYARAIPGIGHCLHTYAGDGNPLPSFIGEPYPVTLGNDPVETARKYWELLNPDHRVSLLVKSIEIADGAFRIEIINKNNHPRP